MRVRGPSALLVAALALAAAPAQAEPPLAPKAPRFEVDPAYQPAAHGGLPYGTYMLMSRGTRRRSTGMMVSGIVITALGAVAMGTGTGIYFRSSDCSNGDSPVGLREEFIEPVCNNSAIHKAGLAIMLTGLITSSLGVPLWILGATDVPWAEAAGKNERAPLQPFGRAPSPEGLQAPSWARIVPTVAPAHKGVTFAWRF
jgi:hypothetical protein